MIQFKKNHERHFFISKHFFQREFEFHKNKSVKTYFSPFLNFILLFNEYKLRNLSQTNRNLVFYIRGVRTILAFYLAHPQRLIVETFGTKYFFIRKDSRALPSMTRRAVWVGRSAVLSGWESEFVGLDFEHERFRAWHKYDFFIFGSLAPKLEEWKHSDVDYDYIGNIETKTCRNSRSKNASLIVREFKQVNFLHGQFIETGMRITGTWKLEELNTNLMPDCILNSDGITKLALPIRHSSSHFRVLYCGQNKNYFHFVTEILTLLVAAIRERIEFEKLVMESNLPPQFYEFAQFLCEKELIFFDPYTSWSVKELVLVHKPDKNMSLLERYSPEIKELQYFVGKKLNLPFVNFRIIFISRTDNLYRPLQNRRVIQKIAKESGLEIIEPSELSFMEQARIFSSSILIVAESGAALTNLVFCKPGTKVIEIQPFKGQPGFWRSYSEILGLIHFEIRGEFAPLSSTGVNSDGYRVSPSKFQKLLERTIQIDN